MAPQPNRSPSRSRALVTAALATLFSVGAARAQAAGKASKSAESKSAEKDAWAADEAAGEEAAPAPVAAPAAPAAIAPTPNAPAAAAAVAPTPKTSGVTATLYGFIELDMMHDSTQSFNDAVVNNTMARPESYAGQNPRTQFTARDSRVGLRLEAPAVSGVKTTALVEVDFFGNQAANATEDEIFSAPSLRLRHAYVKFETPILDVLAGHTHDLFAWGGNGFYPQTTGFLGVPGEIFHRDPQLRLSKVLSTSALTLEIAVAATRPAQRNSEVPDGQGGLRLAVESWRGTNAGGASLPRSMPLSIGVSGIYRRFVVPAFTASAVNPNKTFGWGAAVNLFLPIIPASSASNLSNALSVTAEATTGTGIANLYTALTGGVFFPSLPNPAMTLPVPVFTPGIDNGLVTYDAAGVLHTINWRALVLGLQYRFPFEMGRRLGFSAIASQLESNNIDSLTPQQGLYAVFSKAQYVDGNLFLALTPESQIAGSVQLERQTFGDGVYGNNIRGELAVYYFF
jgi:hypothetical protein